MRRAQFTAKDDLSYGAVYRAQTTARSIGYYKHASKARWQAPNQLWVADITSCIAIATGFVYLAAILDAWSRRVVGYAISRSIARALPLRR